jgi:hypothetical protein
MQDKKTLRPLLEGFTQMRDADRYRLPDDGWVLIHPEYRDDPIPENMRFERQGDRLIAYRLNVGSLHWYVCGKYELR